jgi:hypothetical protein
LTVFELFASEDEMLLVGRDEILILERSAVHVGKRE